MRMALAVFDGDGQKVAWNVDKGPHPDVGLLFIASGYPSGCCRNGHVSDCSLF